MSFEKVRAQILVFNENLHDTIERVDESVRIEFDSSFDSTYQFCFHLKNFKALLEIVFEAILSLKIANV